MNIAYEVGRQYREDGTLNPPAGLTETQCKEWEQEAMNVLREELRSV